MPNQPATIRQSIALAQVSAHYELIPAMASAQVAGGLFTVWVLWDAVQNVYLIIGGSAIVALSLLRWALWRWHKAMGAAHAGDLLWKVLAVAGSLMSGSVWGSAALFLFPPQSPGYELYLLVLLTLLPVLPVAALAVYMPAFYAYYLPCAAPFVVTLVLHGGRPELMTALLLVMMLGAVVIFAHRYARGLTDAMQLRFQLTEKTQALEQLIGHKNRFLAAASHDLLQPAHAMGLFLESLRHGQGDATHKRWVDHLEASLRSLLNMLNNILETSRLDADALRAHKCRFPVGELLQRLSAEFAPLAARQGLSFRCVVKDMVVHSDPELLERMLRNLLSNALKCTRHGGIALVCRSKGSDALLQVWDTGVGIRPEHLNEIFQEFTQIDNPARGDDRGLGLGLAIVKRLALLLDHRIGVRSNFGRGSVFSIEVARSKVDADSPLTNENLGSEIDMVGRLIVMVIDDMALGSDMAVLTRLWGCRTIVDTAASSALSALSELGQPPDLLIVDFRLCDGALGLDAIALFEDRLGRKLPAIMIAEDIAPQHIREAYGAGYMLLHKPVDPRQLRVCMAQAWKGRPV